MADRFLLSVSILLIATLVQAQGKELKKLNSQNSKKERHLKPIGKPTFKVTNEHTWEQGQSAKSLGVKRDEGICFLTKVAGHFAGHVEHVHVYIDGADGEWKLGGDSHKLGVSGKARCIVTSVTYQ